MRNRGFTVLEVATTYFDKAVLEFTSLFENEVHSKERLLERYMQTVDLHMVIRDLDKPDIGKFDFILYDRHFLDKRVFFELETGKEWPVFFEQLVINRLYPQINMYFKINPRDAFLRLSRKRLTLDWKETIDSLERSSALFEKYLNRDSAARVDVDASLSENLVLNQVMEHLAGVHFQP